MDREAAERMTIGHLARTAGVGVETVRYDQRRALLPVPARANGGYRTYGTADVARLRFIRRAQELGFSLDEVGQLLRLADASDRRLTKDAARRLAQARLEQVLARRDDLDRIARVLAHLIRECERSGARPACPIIESITGESSGGSGRAQRARRLA